MGDFKSDPGYEFLAVSAEEKIAFTSKPFDSKKNCWVAGTNFLGFLIKIGQKLILANF
jgi:hypothetical protein